DLWELSLRGHPAWRRLSPSGTRPPARYHHTLTLDPVYRRFLLMGGQRWVLGNCEDVWELTLSGSAWSKVSTAGVCPALRAGHSAVYCPDLGGVLVFGGRQPLMVLPPVMNDLWLLSTEGAATWQELRPR